MSTVFKVCLLCFPPPENVFSPQNNGPRLRAQVEQGAAVPACDVQYRGDQSIIQEGFSQNTRIIVLHW